ncbi:MAG: hypothetical protein C6I01_01950 [Epsilonproteobacteria bacterium]|nr:hypothetical protein [Campylobacterota bacterium]NPA89410.1 hypothetical protein [Campylobacterota bacterium]
MEKKELEQQLETLFGKLDRLVNKRGAENEVNQIFHQILETIFPIINEKIEKGERLNPTDRLEQLVTRGMYEYVMELWGAGELEEAKEVALDMASLVDDENIQQMFALLAIGIMAGIPIEKFIREYMITNTSPYLDYFFVEFSNKIDPLVEKYRERFQKEFSGES